MLPRILPQRTESSVSGKPSVRTLSWSNSLVRTRLALLRAFEAFEGRSRRLAALRAVLSIAALAVFIAATTPGKKERLAALSDEERAWVTEFVAPIIWPEEEKLFLELTRPHEREIFKEDFWARRERPGLVAPLGPGYRMRYADLRRLADERYDGWKQDAGRMVLRWGEPDSVQRPACSEIFREV